MNYIVESLLDPINATYQAISRYNTCLNNPHHAYNEYVDQNTYSAWESYFKSDKSRLYSKGTVRLQTLIDIYTHPTYLSLNTNQAWFVVAGSLVVLQVYGDGNHRTAGYVYNKFTGGTICTDIFDSIHVSEDLEKPLSDKAITDLIEKIVSFHIT